MKKEEDYIQKLTEIRSMMEQSSKFLSLSGWAGIMAGIYALSGAAVAHYLLGYPIDKTPAEVPDSIYWLAISVLGIALITAVFFSYIKAKKNQQRLWNHTARRLLTDMAVPLLTGAVIILILIKSELITLIVPVSLIFYGLALYNAAKFTLREVKVLGLVQLTLGLLSAGFPEYGLIFWSLGFGLSHIIYGIYMHYKYEK